MHKCSLMILSVFSGLLFASTSFAELMIEQGKVVIKANPGETVVDTVTVHNVSKTQTMHLRVSWEDFTYTEPYTEGRKEFMPSGTGPFSCGSWLSYSPQEFTLEPLGTKNITYSLQVPENAKGGYYGVLLFQEGGNKPGQIGVSILTRIGALFFVEISRHNKLAKIENILLKNQELQGEYQNQGDLIMIPDATYYIMDNDGLIADRGEMKKFYLPPGAKTPFSFKISDQLKVGQYTAVITFDLGDGDSVTKEIDFQKNDGGLLEIVKVHD